MYGPQTNLIAGVWLALFLFAFVGWCVNKLFGKPRMNWSAWLAGWYLIAFVLSVVLIMRSPVDTAYELGRHFGLYFVPAILAFLYSRWWRKKHALGARLNR